MLWYWERLLAGGDGGDGWMASSTQWTWIWVNSGTWWRTGKPGMLQSMGSKRVGHDWVTEQQQQPKCSFWNHPLSSSLCCPWSFWSHPYCLIAGLGKIPKLWLSSNLKCVTHRPRHQNSLLESGRKDFRQQRKGGGVCSEAVLSLPFDCRGLTGCFFANGRHRSLWVSFVSRRGWTGEPRTGTGKQEVEDLVILQGRARTDMEARQCLEGPKNVLPCGQQQARSQEPGARKEQGQAMVHAVGGGTGQCCPSRAHHRVCWLQSPTWLNTQLWAAGSGDAEVVADVGKEGFCCSYCKQRGPGVLGMETCDWWGTVVPRTARATFLHSPSPGS